MGILGKIAYHFDGLDNAVARIKMVVQNESLFEYIATKIGGAHAKARRTCLPWKS